MKIVSIYKFLKTLSSHFSKKLLCFLSFKSITLFIAGSGAASYGLFCLGLYNNQNYWDQILLNTLDDHVGRSQEKPLLFGC